MTRHSNLAQHLVDTLNILCGRFVRAGERIDNPGLVMNPGPKAAQVVNLPRPWETGPRSRIGDFGLIGGEMVTGTLADDILRPGDGQVRILFNHGGNPAAAVPDQRKMTEALKSLDLLVSIDPVMSETARLSHYVLPPKLQFERPDIPIYLFEAALFPQQYTRYSAAIVQPPPQAELCDEWRVFYELARRSGRPIDFMGSSLDMDVPPSEDDLIALTLRDAPVTLEELRRHPQGYFHPAETLADPTDPATAGRFTLFPQDVAAEMAAMTANFFDRCGSPFPLPPVEPPFAPPNEFDRQHPARPAKTVQAQSRLYEPGRSARPGPGIGRRGGNHVGPRIDPARRAGGQHGATRRRVHIPWFWRTAG
ncbi:MAG: hypothetical protein DI606_15405 [Sphingobium sp.]|nr:molybdopterin-dependent oxidoreductase [Sphingobium sp.]PZU08361.1 MAG: hypothetical protein DI606_15405 [Sphingobium sp.]